MLFAVPIPEEFCASGETIELAIQEAVDLARHVKESAPVVVVLSILISFRKHASKVKLSHKMKSFNRNELIMFLPLPSLPL